jgi:hypothetical protein
MMKYATLSAFAANIIDGILTIYAYIKFGIAEMNPLLIYPLSISPLIFILVKTFLVGLCLYLLWKRQDKLLARIFILVVLILYLGIILFHSYFLIFVF